MDGEKDCHVRPFPEYKWCLGDLVVTRSPTNESLVNVTSQSEGLGRSYGLTLDDIFQFEGSSRISTSRKLQDIFEACERLPPAASLLSLFSAFGKPQKRPGNFERNRRRRRRRRRL